MDSDRKLTKKEKKELRKLEWQEKQKSELRNEKFKKYSIWGAAILVVLLAIGGLMWIVSQPAPSQAVAVNVAPISSRDITNGNKGAPVTLIEYADFECPACAAYHPIVNQILSTYGKKIYYVYRMFPLENIHPNAVISAQAAYAAWKQGAFFQYDDLLFNNQNDWASLSDPRSVFISYAKQLKLNVTQFTADMNSQEAQNYVKASENEALSEGMDATPTFVLNGQKLTNPSSLQAFEQLINAQINKK